MVKLISPSSSSDKPSSLIISADTCGSQHQNTRKGMVTAQEGTLETAVASKSQSLSPTANKTNSRGWLS